MMVRWVWCFVLVLVSGLVQAQSLALDTAVPSLSGGLSSYRLASGDVISVRVLGEEDLSKEEVLLTDAGTVSLPALGEVRIAGLTLSEVAQLVTQGLLGDYLVNPQVSVSIYQYRPFYINGMVETPGSYPYQPGLTVRKAASLAGGFRERASLRGISIIRENEPGNQSRRVDLDALVQPGDIITVDESFF